NLHGGRAANDRASDHEHAGVSAGVIVSRYRLLLSHDNPEPLHSLSPVLSYIHVALRVDRDAVRLIELTRIMTDPAAEAGQYGAAAPIDDFNLCVALIQEVDEFLRWIAGERNR